MIAEFFVLELPKILYFTLPFPTGYYDSNSDNLLSVDDEYIRQISLIMGEVNIFDYAIFANKELELGTNTSGNVGTNGVSVGVPSSSGTTIEGNIYLGQDASDDTLASLDEANGDYITDRHPGLDLPEIIEDDFDDGYPQEHVDNINEPYFDDLTEIDFSGGETITINLVDDLSDYELADLAENHYYVEVHEEDGVLRADVFVDLLVLGGKSQIQIDGKGDLHLLVRGDDPITLGGSTSISTTDDTRLFLYYIGPPLDLKAKPKPIIPQIDIGGNINITGGIYAPYSDISFNGGGNEGGVDGFVICNNFDGGTSSSFTISNEDAGIKMSDINIFGIPGYDRKYWQQQ